MCVPSDISDPFLYSTKLKSIALSHQFIVRCPPAKDANPSVDEWTLCLAIKSYSCDKSEKWRAVICRFTINKQLCLHVAEYALVPRR